MQNNAVLFMKYVKATYPSVTLNAIAGILGNLEKESTINSGRWQSDSVGTTSGGFGFIQWTPSTVCTNVWNSSGHRFQKTYTVTNTRTDPEFQIDLIMAELGLTSYPISGYWINRSGGYNGLSGSWYPYLSKSAFLTSTKDAYTLALVYHACREGSGDGSAKIEKRGKAGQAWYDYLKPFWDGAETGTNDDITDSGSDTEKKEKKATDNKLLSGIYNKRKTIKWGG